MRVFKLIKAHWLCFWHLMFEIRNIDIHQKITGKLVDTENMLLLNKIISIECVCGKCFYKDQEYTI